MRTTTDPHQQFAEFFGHNALKPYAYLLSKALSEGHICLPLSAVESRRDELPLWYAQLLDGKSSPDLLPLVATGGNDAQPFVLHGDRLYLQRYFRYESACLKRLQDFLRTGEALLAERTALLEAHRNFIQSLFPPATDAAGNPIPDWQLAAAITAALQQFTIITGGPGTGKTTTVARLLALLFTLQPGLKVALAAQTGKAAARMAESLRASRIDAGEEVQQQLAALAPATIHRLLKPVRNTPYFQHNAALPLPYDLVIADESSMIDAALFAKLLDAIGPDTRLILLGDKDQLASVEAGSLFGDLCGAQDALNRFSTTRRDFINSFAHAGNEVPVNTSTAGEAHPLFQHIVELQYSRRFSGEKGIGLLSRAIIQSDEAVLRQLVSNNVAGEVGIDTGYSAEVLQTFIHGYEAYLRESDIATALGLLNNCRVLCAVREGAQGLYALNKAIEHRLQQLRLIHTGAEFYEHRPIILTRNYYEHGLFNGDTGIIRKDGNGTLMAWFSDSDGGLKAVLPGYLTDAETAFAMTIHKSQGSEFNEVLVVLPAGTDSAILTRELLYTGVTRARNKVIIQATPEVLLQTASRKVQRASGIAERLVEGTATVRALAQSSNSNPKSALRNPKLQQPTPCPSTSTPPPPSKYSPQVWPRRFLSPVALCSIRTTS